MKFTSFWAENDISHLIIFGNLVRWNDNNIEKLSVIRHYGSDCALNHEIRENCTWFSIFSNAMNWRNDSEKTNYCEI